MLRRSAKIGAVAVAAAPVIDTVLIPSAAAASSTGGGGGPPQPPKNGTFLGTITNESRYLVVTIPIGLNGSGRHLVRPGDRNAKVFNPETASLFTIKVIGSTFTFVNDLVNVGQVPPYHYELFGTNGAFQLVDVVVPGVALAKQIVSKGPSLNLSIYWVPGP